MGRQVDEHEEAVRSRLAYMRDYAWTVAGILAAALVLAIAYREFIA